MSLGNVFFFIQPCQFFCLIKLYMLHIKYLYCICIYALFYYFNNLMVFWPILDQRKTSLVFFLWKRRTSSVVFWSILFLMAWYKTLEVILFKKNTEIVLLFHKKTTKQVFLWPNMGQKTIKVLKNKKKSFHRKIKRTLSYH